MKGYSNGPSKTCSVASSNKSSNFSSSTRSYSLVVRAHNGRSIHHALASIRRKVKAFKRKHLVGSRVKVDYAGCHECLTREVLPEWGVGEDQVSSHEEFLRLTIRKPLDEELASCDEFIDLLGLSERAQDFENLIKDDKQKLGNLLEQHVFSTCVSLKEEDEGNNLVHVSEYDHVSSDYRAKVTDRWRSLGSAVKEYNHLAHPFVPMVRQGQEVCSAMRQVCSLVLEVCKLADDWVAEDEAYPAKLEEELVSTSEAKEELLGKIREVQDKQKENKTEMEALAKQEERAEKKFIDHRKEKRSLKQRLGQLEERKGMLNASLGKKRKERDQVKAQLSDHGTAIRDLFDLNNRLTDIGTSIDRLEEQKKVTARQFKRVTKDIGPVTEKTYEHKVEMVTARHHKENFAKENCDLDIDLTSLQKRLTYIDGLLLKLRSIREQKLSGEAFRKSLRQRHRKEAAYANGSHELEEACRVAAPGIGKDWKTVYLRLPFDPPRDPTKLQRDLSVLDQLAYRGDVPPDQQALKSLERWRTLHRRGGIQDLVQTLRDVKKKRLATEIHNRFVPVPV